MMYLRLMKSSGMKVFYLALFTFYVTACQTQHKENASATVSSTTTVLAAASIENFEKAAFEKALHAATSLNEVLEVVTVDEGGWVRFFTQIEKFNVFF